MEPNYHHLPPDVVEALRREQPGLYRAMIMAMFRRHPLWEETNLTFSIWPVWLLACVIGGTFGWLLATFMVPLWESVNRLAYDLALRQMFDPGPPACRRIGISSSHLFLCAFGGEIVIPRTPIDLMLIREIADLLIRLGMLAMLAFLVPQWLVLRRAARVARAWLLGPWAITPVLVSICFVTYPFWKLESRLVWAIIFWGGLGVCQAWFFRHHVVNAWVWPLDSIGGGLLMLATPPYLPFAPFTPGGLMGAALGGLGFGLVTGWFLIGSLAGNVDARTIRLGPPWAAIARSRGRHDGRGPRPTQPRR